MKFVTPKNTLIMQKIFTVLLFCTISLSIPAQAPQSFNYQAVLRNQAGEPLSSEEVTVKVDILKGTAAGTEVFSETHNVSTNEFGLVNLKIGSLQPLEAVDWAADIYFLQVSVNGIIMGTTQLLSVPYALHSKTAETVEEEIDPVFEASPAAGIEAADISNWHEAHTWGDHSQQGYLTDYTVTEEDVTAHQGALQITEQQITDLQDYLIEETDPVFEASPAAGIEAADISNWHEAHTWGDHSQQGYITDYIVTEEDVTAHQGALQITEEQITDLQGYLIEETDPLFSAWDKSTGIMITESQISDLKAYLLDITGEVIGDLSDVDLTGLEGGKVLKYDQNEEKWIVADDLGITEETDPLFTQWDKSTGILITEDQIIDLQAYLTEIPAGSLPGEMMYWNGSTWVAIEPGQYGQTLNFCNGVPTWGECPAAVPVVTTGSVTDITPTIATGGGTVVSQGSAFVTGRGIVWSSEPNPTTGTNEGQLSLGSGTGSFSGNMTGLTEGTEYFVRAYAINAEGTAYGNQVSFTTEDQTVFPPTISTVAVTDITMSSATSGGNITDNGGAAITARGVLWNNSNMPTVEEHLGITNEGGSDENFVSNITGLQPNTQYYVRAYAINSQGVAYGEQRIFITLQDLDLPTVITAEITDITQTLAKGGGEVTADGGGDVLARGVCWAKHESPTLDDFYVESGTGLGVFESDITGLTLGQTYYVRAFATNASGRSYGNQVSFSALAGLPDIEIVSKATAAGEIIIVADATFDGGAGIIDRGVVWDTEDNPSLEQNLGSASEGTGTGEFTSIITGLTPNTLYYITAYATNSEGTTYSESVNINYWEYHGTVSDIDGNVYNTVMIGDQEWMAENLKVTAYRNNVTIFNLENQNDWNNTEDGAYVWHNNDISWKDHYGALYNWYAVNDPRGICPTGWSVPSDDDWQELADYLGGSNVAGGKLKSTRTEPDPHPRWFSPNTGATNETGFSALPGGSRMSWGFYGADELGYWWSSVEHSETSARNRNIWAWEVSFYGETSGKRTGNSVRCIRD